MNGDSALTLTVALGLLMLLAVSLPLFAAGVLIVALWALWSAL